MLQFTQRRPSDATPHFIRDEIDYVNPAIQSKNWPMIARNLKGSLLERAVSQVKELECKQITKNMQEMPDGRKWTLKLA